jgi:RNA recognition motif-containing protein
MSVKLYVAGVSWTTTDEGFRLFFNQFGPIEEALVMRESAAGRSRGFGFVTFKDAAIAEKVLTQDLELDGRKLDLKKAVPKTEMVQQQQVPSEVDQTPSSKKLYVAGISFTATEDQVASFFGRFGQVQKVTIIKDKQASRSRGFGFVSFVDEGVVQDVLAQHDANKLEWEGRTLELKAAVPKGASSLSSGTAGRSKKLYVAGLLLSTTDEALMAYFSKFGVVTEATIQKNRGTGESRGFGFVTFQDTSSVDRVLEQSHMLDNQPIDCKVAVPKLQQSVFPMGGSSIGGNNWTNSNAWNTPASQHFPVSAGGAFARAALDVRDVRNNVDSDRGFAGAYNTNQNGGYADRFGPTSAVGGTSYSAGYGGPPSGLGGLGGASRLPSQGSYGTANYVSAVGGGFENSYEHGGARTTYAAPSYARTEPNYYSDETSYGGYDRQRPRVGYHPYSR